MRIAICTDQYLPLVSGLVDSVEALTMQLRKNGHVVRIYAPRLQGAPADPDIFHFPSWSVPGSKDALILTFPFGAMRDMRAFKPDIVHTELFGMSGWLAWLAARRLKVPLVGTDHTFPADYLHYLKLNFPPFPFLVRTYAAWYYNRCAFVTTPSRQMLDELRAYGFTRPANVISNPIQTIFRKLDGKDVLKKTLGVGDRTIAVFGRLTKEKNLDIALEIFENVAKRTDAHLVFIGDGTYRAHLEKRVHDTGMEERVHFHGMLRGDPLVEALNACDVYLITSTSETQSLTLIQSMACGLPSVAADSGGLKDYVEHEKTGYLVAPADVAAFADRIVELLQNDDLRARMGAEAASHAANWSPSRIAAKFEAVYEKVRVQTYR